MLLRVVAALLLIAMGLYLAGWWSGLTRIEALGRGLWRYIQPLTRRFMPVTSLPRALLLGGLWGWLPCGLVYSTLLWAASQGDALDSAALMLAFGLGTLPVLLATGIVDRMPPLAGVEDAIAAGVVRLCAVCDGYEAGDEDIAVYGPIADAIDHALFLRTFSRRVTAIASDAGAPDAGALARARQARVAVLPMPLRLRHDADRCVAEFADAGERSFDTLYPVLSGDAQSGLATALGARVDDNHELLVDDQQQTSVDGLYAIGDIVSALNQISVAVGHAAIAASAIHNRLPRNFREQA